MRTFCLLTILLTTPQIALATQEEKLESALGECAEIDNDIARLDCFDTLVAGLAKRGEGRADAAADPAPEETEEAAPEATEEATAEATADVEPAKNIAAKDEEDASGTEPTPRPKSFEDIVEADENMVADCKFLGSVRGKSGWGGVAGGRARAGALRSAKKRTFEKGGTHLVVRDFRNASGWAPKHSDLEGRAYDCTQKPGG